MRLGFCALMLGLSGCGPRQLVVTMNAENNSGQRGLATATQVTPARLRVDLDIAPADDTQPLPAHIHPGTCGEIGKIHRSLNSLELREGRFTSATEVEMTLDELAANPFAINVHDARDFSLYVSCGELKP